MDTLALAQDCAVSALSHVCGSYYSVDAASIAATQGMVSPPSSRDMTTRSPPGKLILAYTTHLLSHIAFVRMGYALALGSFPRPLLRGQLRVVLDPLMSSCQVTQDAERQFAEARRNAVLAITR